MEQREPAREELFERIRTLEERLWEAEQTIQAIQSGEVDALVVHKPDGEQIYSLTGADHGYRVLVESVSEGALILSSDDSIYYCNRTLGEMLQLPIQKIISRRLDSYFAAETRPRLMELIKEIHRLGAAKGEFLMKRFDGTLLPVNVSLNRFRMEGFEGVCAVIADMSDQKRVEEELRRHRTELERMVEERTADLATTNAELLKDITERKRAEMALIQAHERLQMAHHAAGAGTWDWDITTGQVEWSDKLFEIFGFDPEKSLASFELWESLLHPEDLEIASTRINRSLQEQVDLISEYRIVLPNGQLRWISALGRGSYDEYGNPVRMTGICMDITERKLAEENLRTTVQRFHGILSNIFSGILVVTGDDRIEFVNQNFCDQFSIVEAPSDLIGLAAKEMLQKALPAYADPEANLARIQQILSQRHRIEDEEVLMSNGRMLTRDQVPLMVDGKPSGLMWQHRDITERKRIEEERRQFERQRLQLLKAESLTRMAGAIAHHFNNQLGTAMGNLELAMIDLPKGARPHANITEAMKACQRAAEVSGQMLTYLGQTPGIRELLDLSEVCRRGLVLLQVTMPQNVTLETELPSLGPTIAANPSQLKQVLTNLVTNAREAIGDDPGSIHLEVRTVSSADIPATHRFPFDWQPQDKAYSCLEVADTGCGIEDKEIEKIFDPFFSSKFTGRGLGLSTVLGIVRTQGGVITVKSDLGRGSVFRVFFPMAGEEVARQPEQAVEAPQLEGGGTVLLVEDDEMMRKMVETLLTHLGFTVIAAKDGVEAVELFRKHRDEFRCVLCDLTMPRMSGWDTLAAIRALRPDIPVVLASGYDEARVLEGKGAELPQAFLHKPYRMAELKAALGAAMGTSLPKV
jgi:PAS domain S-box-containing protein